MTYKEFGEEIKGMELRYRVFGGVIEVLLKTNDTLVAIVSIKYQYEGSTFFVSTLNETKRNKLAHVCWELIKTSLDERGIVTLD